MSYISIPNQPIIFHTEAEIQTPCIECGDGSYKQLVDLNDQLFFQVEAPDCTDKLPVSSLSSVIWSLSGGIVCSTEPSNGSASVTFTTPYPYQVYKLNILVTELTQGDLVVTLQNGESFTFYTAGTYTIYLSTQAAINGDLSLQVNFASTTFVGCFNLRVGAYGVGTDMQLAWVDPSTLEFVAPVIDYITTIKDNKVTAAIPMVDQEIGIGCHRLAITDPCENGCSVYGIENPNFNGLVAVGGSGSGWDLTDGIWEISGGQAIFTDVLISDEAVMISDSFLCAEEDSVYEVTIKITAIEDTRIFIVPPSGGSVTPAYVAGVGTFTFQVTTGAFAEPLTIKGQAMANGASAYIDSCIVKLSAESSTFVQYSEVFDLGDYNDTCRYFKIEGCNAQDQFNLAFGGSSFLPMIRLEGRRSKAQYESNAKTFRYASGKWSANYVDRIKQWTFHFGRLPEYVLDFLSTIFYYDNCYVNGVLMFPQDDNFPSVEYQDADTYLGSFDIDLVEKISKVVKVQCGDSDADCLPSILDNSDEPFLLTQDLNRITTQDSVNLYYENNL
jgi:hypothetical protein